MSRRGSNFDAYSRVPLCKACGNPFVPPGYSGACSERCVSYLAVANQPVLGDPVYCQRDEPIKCWGCEVSFISRGLRFCPECWDRSRSTEAEVGVGTGLAPARRDEPISDRNPRSKFCHW